MYSGSVDSGICNQMGCEVSLLHLNGEQAIARGVLASGISIVTGYPGSPSSAAFEALIPLSEEHGFHVEWSSSERVAVEVAIGASIAGRRSLVCSKSVGMNVMLDPLMALNLTPVNGGLVILLGDDPGGYGSQNDQDTRLLSAMLEMPMLEPSLPSEAFEMVQEAFSLSERESTAVIVRITRSFSQQIEAVEVPESIPEKANLGYERQAFRFVPVPINVVEKHRELHRIQKSLAVFSDGSRFNRIEGSGSIGIVAAGFAWSKLLDVIGQTPDDRLRLFKLSVLNPLPELRLVEFLGACVEVLILEETEPFVEIQLKAMAHEYGCEVRIHGSLNARVSREGELFRWEIQNAITDLIPDFMPVRQFRREDQVLEQPKMKGNCGGSRYSEVIDLLEDVAGDLGERLVIVGDPGCLVTVADRIDAKYAIGSSVAVAHGMSKAGMKERPVALIGDSGFFHSTIPAICSAVHNDSDILMVVLDNGSALASGSQSHPGVSSNALGAPGASLSIEEISRACGIRYIDAVGMDDEKSMLKDRFKAAFGRQGPSMVVLNISEVST
jgi:indolepyruvate ferredoxin oxidoreductase, alpha subunit